MCEPVFRFAKKMILKITILRNEATAPTYNIGMHFKRLEVR